MNAMSNEVVRYGALPDEWVHLILGLGLTEDLLPVVANPSAKISPKSKMQAVGKTPSRYNGGRLVAGIAKWTDHKATEEEVQGWMQEPDYGICVQTRTVRAIDVDITDAAQAAKVRAVLPKLPVRWRSNSSKFLVAFNLPGDYTKRRIIAEHGAIELLATGQQFIAVGTHPSGARYEWEGGLPDDLPELTPEQFEALWQKLVELFAVEPAVSTKAPVKQATLRTAIAEDEVARALDAKGLIRGTAGDGRLDIACPWADEHTTESAESATSYWPAHTGGFAHGGFKCQHAHCADRTFADLRVVLGLNDATDDFEVLFDEAPEPTSRFPVRSEDDMLSDSPPQWFIKGVLPKAAIGAIYGPWGSGKSFLALDMAAAVARGEPWCQHRTKRGRVVYVVAEGQGDFRNRLAARRQRFGPSDIKLITEPPNLLKPKDARALADAILAGGGADLIVLDTLAQVSPGANENSAEDMGKVLAHCGQLHRRTGALVLLVAHSGKDAAKGLRGWSGLSAAFDVQLEVMAVDSAHSVTVEKLKGGQVGAVFGFKLTVETVGVDEDGDPITSCVVEYGAAPVVRKRGPEGKVQQLVVSTLADMTVLTGDNRAHIDELTQAVIAKRVAPGKGKRDTRGQVVRRAVDAMVAEGLLVLDGASVSLGEGVSA